jgi:Rieske Fe-S protein
MTPENQPTRRGMLMNIGILLNGAVAAVLAVPVVRYLLSSVTRAGAYDAWVSIGPAGQFPEGETRLAMFRNAYGVAADGQTANTACWVRHVGANQFQVFAVNCAHLGCPVRWFPQSGLFLCPCHGGAYYRDGTRAAGPPERGMFEYPHRIENGVVMIQAGELPTPGASTARLGNCAGCEKRTPCA